jgi:hypothetical protein
MRSSPCAQLCWAILLSLAPLPARAAEPWSTTVDLLTIGPGDHLFNRFGHTALLVMRTRPGTKQYESVVYNYGDANFNDPRFAYDFLRGRVSFFLSNLGSLNQTVTLYANMDRTIEHQRLNLSPAQVQRLVAILEERSQVDRREYPYHHLRASCATKVRDVLDEVLGGAIRRQLEPQRDPRTVRTYARRGYAGHLGGEVFNDLFMGRLHDQPRSKLFQMYLPELLRDYLRQVNVPDPQGGGKLVPLVGAPRPIYTRRAPSPLAGEGRTLIHLCYVMIFLLVAVGIHAWRGGAAHVRRSGAWLLLWSLPFGLAALLMVIGATCSTVAEGRINELMLVFPLTDLALWGVAWRWLRGRANAGRLLRGYAWVRLGLAVLSLVGHAVGWLYQEPRILVVLALVAAVGLVLLTRRLPAVRAAADLPWDA